MILVKVVGTLLMITGLVYAMFCIFLGFAVRREKNPDRQKWWDIVDWAITGLAAGLAVYLLVAFVKRVWIHS